MSIIVVGSLNNDMVISTKKMPLIGETINGDDFFTSCGGKGANQAVALGRITNNVMMVGSVGNDIFGEKLIDSLKQSNVNSDNVLVKDCQTGTAVIVVVNGDNFIIIDKGANGLTSVEDLERMKETFKSAKYVVLQLEIPMETVKKAIEIAKSCNAKVVLNPAPAVELEDYFYQNTDIMILNESEAELLTGIKIDNEKSARVAIDILNKRGVETAIVTLGENGVVYNSGETVKTVKSVKVKAVDTTSAGDSFIGAMVGKLDNGCTIDEAIQFAVYAAALTVTKKGAQISLPTYGEVEEFINSLT